MHTAYLGPLFLLAACCASVDGSAAADDEAGWVELFDGESLDGWVTQGGRYDGAAQWTVEDGALTGRQGEGRTGGLIYTEALYDDFELELDVRIDYPFDSGIFVRMQPRETELKGAQVTIDWREGGEIGGIYSDGWLQHRPEGAELFEKDDWNRFRVRCVGPEMELETWLNGEPLGEFRLEGDPSGYARTGRIGLQVHGGESVAMETRVQFKRVRLRPLQ